MVKAKIGLIVVKVGFRISVQRGSVSYYGV